MSAISTTHANFKSAQFSQSHLSPFKLQAHNTIQISKPIQNQHCRWASSSEIPIAMATARRTWFDGGVCSGGMKKLRSRVRALLPSPNQSQLTHLIQCSRHTPKCKCMSTDTCFNVQISSVCGVCVFEKKQVRKVFVH